jgi:xylitol oxidase
MACTWAIGIACPSATRSSGSGPRVESMNTMPPRSARHNARKVVHARDLFERLDPDGTFSNHHLQRLGVRAAREP